MKEINTFFDGNEWNKFLESYKKMLNIHMNTVSQITVQNELAIKSMSNLIKSLTPSIEYIEQWSNKMSKMINSTMNISLKTNFELMNKSINAALNNYNWSNLLKNYDNIINSINIDSLEINSDGTIEYENEILSIQKENVNEAVATLKNIEKNTTDIKNSINNKKPVVLIIILFIISGIAGGFLNKCGETIFELLPNAYNNYIEENKTNTKELFIENFRIVNAKELNVREESSSKSRLVGKLYMNQCVEVIEKTNYWSKIRYINKQKEIKIIGWVYNRYLSYIDEETSELLEEK